MSKNYKKVPSQRRKRDLRAVYRNEVLQRKQKIREDKRETIERSIESYRMVAEAFREDNKKHGKADKKPGPEKFLALYSYIPSTAFDARYQIPAVWKPHTFNEQRQHIEFIKSFVYPYPLPETLLWATHSPEFMVDYKGVKYDTHDSGIIKLAKKWIIDITSGQSFYKRNCQFFTKAEAHFFLNSKIAFVDNDSVIKLYFYAKCMARGMNHKTSDVIADVFSVKFTNQFRNSLVEGFLDLLARTPEYNYERGLIGDLCDFILAKILDNRNLRKRPGAFTFSGRTITSVIGLTNEWHEQLRRDAEVERVRRTARIYGRLHDVETSKWKGMNIAQFKHITDEYTWTVTELRTAQNLLNEGRKMKNCVASYSYDCATGSCAIFSLERIYPLSHIVENVATLEVSQKSRTLIQAKGKCNTAVASKAMGIINRWAQANRITVKIQV